MRRMIAVGIGVLLLVGAASALARTTYPTTILEKYSEPISGIKYRSLVSSNRLRRPACRGAR